MKKFISGLLCVLALSFLPASGQNDLSSRKQSKELKKGFAIFDSDELLEMSLSFDLKKYLKKDFKETLDGILTFRLSESDSLEREVKISNRGTFRSSFCKFPPIEIYFKKPVHAYTGQDKITRLKLITRCDEGKQYDEYVLREFLVYKLYNAFTDTSFRVRLVRVDFIDINNKKNPIRQYGFFIEPKEIVASRTNLSLFKNTRVGQKHIFPAIMDRVAIFNYMVSNYDWSVTGEHNIILMQPVTLNPSGLGIAVPHDFDATGVVNASYAIPKPETNLTSIRDRIFMGTCRSKEVFQQELKSFLKRKDDLYHIIDEFAYLGKGSKKDITVFLDEFFNQIEKQKTLDELIGKFMKTCLK
jgi:hypothetical protein